MAHARKDPTRIALLGATGKTGQVVLQTLLPKENLSLQIYVRSKSKLEGQVPGIENRSNISIIEGSATSSKAIKACLSNAAIIICTLGSNDYEGSTILRDSTRSILQALGELRGEHHDWKRPRMIYLSSSSQNTLFAAARPPGVDWLIKTAFQKGYEDLTEAEAMLLTEPNLVSLLRVQPGILIEEEGTGYEISTASVRLAASYPDLGRSFVELALDRKYDSLSEVGVSSKGGDRFVRYAPTIVSRITAGIFTVYCGSGSTARRTLFGLSAVAVAWLCLRSSMPWFPL